MEVHHNDARTQTPCVLALCGRRRAGKDTIASHLLAGEGDDAEWGHVKISHALKRCVSYLFDIKPEELEGDDKDRVIDRPDCVARGVTPRSVMQWFGTEVMQYALPAYLLPTIGRHFWINRAVVDIRRELTFKRNVVISDVRFPHELDVLAHEFGNGRLLALYVERKHTASTQAECTPDDAHESEALVDKLKERAITVVNVDGDVSGFLKKCDALIRDHGAWDAATVQLPPYS